VLVTSGDGMHYPYGIPVARISAVEDGRVSVSTLYDRRNLEFVSIYVR
jgi:cell shape-determining protein MreC